MKKYILILCLILIACSKSTKSPARKIPVVSCSVTPTRLDFPYPTNDSSFMIKNTGETILYGSLTVRDEIPQGWRYFYIESPVSYSLNPNDSIVVLITYYNLWNSQTINYREEGIVETGHPACQDVYCTGR